MVAKTSAPPTEAGKVKLLGDTVTLKPYEGKFVRIETTKLAQRLPDLLRALKRFVGIRETDQ